MTKELIVRTGPQEYECREDVLSTLPKRLEERFVKNILIVHGTVSWQKARPYLEDLYQAGFVDHRSGFFGRMQL